MRNRFLLAAASAAAIFSVTTAHAADFMSGISTPTTGAYVWTGAYVGVTGGVTGGDYEFDLEDSGMRGGLEVDGDGFTGGAQVGYDYQVGNIVLGAVADIALTNHEAEIAARIDGLGSADVSSELNYLGTVRGRLGYGFNRTLVYGHGGLAYGETEQTAHLRDTNGTTVFTGTVDDNETKFGYAVGAGLEYMLLDTVSLQTEYSFVDLGTDTLYQDASSKLDETVDFHTIKAGINLRF